MIVSMFTSQLTIAHIIAIKVVQRYSRQKVRFGMAYSPFVWLILPILGRLYQSQ